MSTKIASVYAVMICLLARKPARAISKARCARNLIHAPGNTTESEPRPAALRHTGHLLALICVWLNLRLVWNLGRRWAYKGAHTCRETAVSPALRLIILIVCSWHSCVRREWLTFIVQDIIGQASGTRPLCVICDLHTYAVLPQLLHGRHPR